AVGDRVSTGDVLMIVDGEAAESPASGDGAASSGGASPGGGATSVDAAAAPSVGSAAQAPAGGAAAAGASAQAATAAGEAPPRPVVVPDLGDFSDVEVIDVLVADGDAVDAEQGLITLETEKAAMDVPAPEAGVIVSLKVKVGDRVSAGDEIAVLKPAAT